MNEKRRFRQRLKDFDLTLPESKREYNRMLFTPVAQVYSGITRVLSFGRDAVWKGKLISLLPEIPEPRILDLACGPGDLSFLLALRYPSARIEGIDLNTDMLARAASNLARMPGNIQERINFFPGDMNELPFSDGEFDIISGGYALRNSPTWGAAWRRYIACEARGIRRVSRFLQIKPETYGEAAAWSSVILGASLGAGLSW